MSKLHEMYISISPYIPKNAYKISSPACPDAEDNWLDYLTYAAGTKIPIEIDKKNLRLPEDSVQPSFWAKCIQKPGQFGVRTLLTLDTFPGLIARPDGAILRPLRLSVMDESGAWIVDRIANLLVRARVPINRELFLLSVTAANQRMEEFNPEGAMKPEPTFAP